MCVCVYARSVGQGLTSVRDEGDLEERSNEAWDVSVLVVVQTIPLVEHKSVHSYPHVAIATAHTHTHTHITTSQECDTGDATPYLSNILFLLISLSCSSCKVA